MKTRYLASILAVAVYCLLPSTTNAQQVLKYTDYGFSDPADTMTFALANGDTLTTGRYYFHTVPATEGWPTAVQYCVQTFLTSHGHGRFGSGSCMRYDTDGDVLNFVWTNPDGGEEGSFRSVSGTGKYADLACQGTWRGTDPFNGLVGRWINKLEMTCAER